MEGVIMKKLKTLLNLIKVMIIITFVFIVQFGTNCLESKVENINLNKTLDLSAMTEIDWSSETNKDYVALGTKIGSLTGYAADCPLCSGRLGCSPYLDVRDRTTEYQDSEFGTVRIIAASKNNLQCGSVIKFSSDRISNTPVIAIVLDRGVGGDAIDLLAESQEVARTQIGRSTITYEVLRNGWES